MLLHWGKNSPRELFLAALVLWVNIFSCIDQIFDPQKLSFIAERATQPTGVLYPYRVLLEIASITFAKTGPPYYRDHYAL